MKRRNEREDDACPFCGLSESVEHVYKCKDPRVQTIWEDSLQEFSTFLKGTYTDPMIIEQLLAGMKAWRTDTDLPNQPMIIDQSPIGWNGILEGIMGLHWMEQQHHYASTHSKAMNASKWAHLTIRKLWLIAWALWQHRNEEAHKNDQSQLMETLHLKVQEEIDIGTQGYQELQPWFSHEETTRVLNGNHIYITCWLNAVRARRERFLRREQNAPTFVQMRNTMRQFLNIH